MLRCGEPAVPDRRIRQHRIRAAASSDSACQGYALNAGRSARVWSIHFLDEGFRSRRFNDKQRARDSGKCRTAIVPTNADAKRDTDRSDAPRLNVTEYVTVAAQEYDAVTGWIRSVPFELVVRDFYFRSDLDVRPAARFVGPVVGDLHIGLAVPDMDFIGPVGVGFAAT